MKHYIQFDPQTGEILLYGQCEDDSFQYLDNAIEGQATPADAFVRDGALVFYTPEQKQTKALRVPGFYRWSNETFSWVDTRSAEQKIAIASEQALATRKELLIASDWTQLPNGPLTPEQQQAWAVYRQALRDITQQPGFPEQVIWPSSPGNG